MSTWGARKARIVLAALLRMGWRIKRQSGSHRVLERAGSPDVVFARRRSGADVSSVIFCLILSSA
jgi:predicted RNA binding protein YcfA (HicA-like mRNA interferase family)